MAVQREYLSPNEVAELLGVSPFTIRRYIKMGELKAVKLLGGFRVHRNNLDAFLKAHEVNPAEEELLLEEIHENHSTLPASSPATIATVLKDVGILDETQAPPRPKKSATTTRPRGMTRSSAIPRRSRK